MRHDELLAAGDMEGATVWKRILRAIDELGRKERRPDEELNLVFANPLSGAV